jgi:STE24 endopeptidase
MYGFFFSKRIVLFDSLLKDNTNDEILAVLAHELGHWNYLHSLKLMTVNFVRI